jgi:hypothetical protein
LRQGLVARLSPDLRGVLKQLRSLAVGYQGGAALSRAIDTNFLMLSVYLVVWVTIARQFGIAQGQPNQDANSYKD